MRFMIIVKATTDSEAGVMPNHRIFDAMADYHQQLQAAGVLLDASGLQPSAKGWRIKYAGGKRTLSRRHARLEFEIGRVGHQVAIGGVAPGQKQAKRPDEQRRPQVRHQRRPDAARPGPAADASRIPRRRRAFRRCPWRQHPAW